MSPEQEKIRANQAQQVLDNPVFQEAFTALKASIFQKFEKTRFDQEEERTELWRKLNCMSNLERYLSSVVQTGKMSETDI